MFAVIKTGGKQYKVVQDELIDVEKLDTEVGKTIKIAEVLMVGEGADIKVGDPMVKGAEVTAEVMDQRRDRKVLVFKKKRRQNYRRKAGHRQHKTVLKITGIKA
jgi:large subunit ribosomal protein L21